MTDTTNGNNDKGFIFTGYHMLALLIAFFGVIFAVNFTMAWFANSSWSGLLSKDTYVASQDFNKRAAQAKEWTQEGFKGALDVGVNTVTYRLVGPAEKIARITQIDVLFRRPVGEKHDFSMVLQKQSDGSFAATHNLPKGQWIVELRATENGALIYHQAKRVYTEGSNT